MAFWLLAALVCLLIARSFVPDIDGLDACLRGSASEARGGAPAPAEPLPVAPIAAG